jgi:hypothetical protein
MTSRFHCSTRSTVVFCDSSPLRYRLNLGKPTTQRASQLAWRHGVLMMCTLAAGPERRGAGPHSYETLASCLLGPGMGGGFPQSPRAFHSA